MSQQIRPTVENLQNNKLFKDCKIQIIANSSYVEIKHNTGFIVGRFNLASKTDLAKLESISKLIINLLDDLPVKKYKTDINVQNNTVKLNRKTLVFSTEAFRLAKDRVTLYNNLTTILSNYNNAIDILLSTEFSTKKQIEIVKLAGMLAKQQQ